MRCPLVLTGPPASGKTTCGRVLAGRRERAAFVDVDDIRQLVVSGAAAPWEGEEGDRQRLLGARNAIALAGNLLDAGFEVVVADVLTAVTAAAWREADLGARLVRLRIELSAARSRAAGRPRWITGAEFDAMHAADRERPPEVDAVLDVDALDPAAQLRAIDELWCAG